jgi:predicted helicase
MSDRISRFLSQVQNRFTNSQSIEHAYRPALQELLEALQPDIQAINDGKRTRVGAPDFQIFRKDVTVAYLEAKDITVDLDKELRNKNQITKYQALGNLCFTNNLDWIFFHDEREVARVSIGKIVEGAIIPDLSQYSYLESLLIAFLSRQSITIRSPIQLAKKMAEKSRLMKEIVYNTLQSEEVSRDLQDQYEAFKEDLIHDLTHDEFADIYAQTIAYGLFTARFYDPTLPTFSRDEARNLLPKSNPFLRKFFDHVAGIDMESRIVWIIEDLINMFLYVDVVEVLKDFGSRTQQTDPILHFYETFLGEYDPAKRKSKGVYYTPQPVVDFIVRSVDEVLKKDFGLPRGLSDNSKITQQIDEKDQKDRRDVRVEIAGNNTKKYYVDTHKVQNLDPATGTGTFPLAVMKHIAKDFVNMQGIWPSYVKNDLVPRLHGFEIMMSSYSMAHLKLAMYLKETGVTLEDHQRLDIYLTNSLEEGKDDTHNLFSSWLSNEAKEANYIKNQTPVMVVIGNPPYSGESKNKSDFIMNLMETYKKEPDGSPLKERNPKWINDDYVKFMRFSESLIEKNGEGVLAFITSHSYLDNPTFRGMRAQLMRTFDSIYIVDLHGNSLKKEVSPDGSKDENVFDIQAGTAIFIGVKTKQVDKKIDAKIYHKNVYGKREYKYDWLEANSLKSTDWVELSPTLPYLFFAQKDLSLQVEYEKGIKLSELFPVNSVGIMTARDQILINESKFELNKSIQANYNIEPDQQLVHPIAYRPFDTRHIYYDPRFVERSRIKVMKHMIGGENLGLVSTRFQFRKENAYSCVFMTKNIIDINSLQSPGTVQTFPLYLYPEK